MQASALLLCWGSYCWAHNLLVLFIFPSCCVALCASKAHHRLCSESVSWCLETSLLRFPSWDGTSLLVQSSLPTSFVSFFIFYIFSYLFLKTMICFFGGWCPLPAFRSCFVEFTQSWNVLLMNLWGRKWSPRILPLPSFQFTLYLNFWHIHMHVYMLLYIYVYIVAPIALVLRNLPSNTEVRRDAGSMHGLGRFPGTKHFNPFLFLHLRLSSLKIHRGDCLCDIECQTGV